MKPRVSHFRLMNEINKVVVFCHGGGGGGGGGRKYKDLVYQLS